MKVVDYCQNEIVNRAGSLTPTAQTRLAGLLQKIGRKLKPSELKFVKATLLTMGEVSAYQDIVKQFDR